MEAETKTPVNFEKVFIWMKITPMGTVNNCSDGPSCLKVIKNERLHNILRMTLVDV